MATELFVERVFDDGEEAVICRFYVPVLQPTGEFRCDWTIDWGDRERKRPAHGIDSVQALLLAMRAAHTELVESDSYKAGTLNHLGDRDLDLPPAFTFDDSAALD